MIDFFNVSKKLKIKKALRNKVKKDSYGFGSPAVAGVEHRVKKLIGGAY